MRVPGKQAGLSLPGNGQHRLPGDRQADERAQSAASHSSFRRRTVSRARAASSSVA